MKFKDIKCGVKFWLNGLLYRKVSPQYSQGVTTIGSSRSTLWANAVSVPEHKPFHFPQMEIDELWLDEARINTVNSVMQSLSDHIDRLHDQRREIGKQIKLAENEIENYQAELDELWKE